MHKIKIAVQISGLIHTPQDTLYTFKQFLFDLFDCDVFIASTSSEEYAQVFQPISYQHIDQAQYISAGITNLIDKYFDRYYKHKDGYQYHSNTESILKALYQKYVCNQLRLLSKKTYDVVVWLRGDLCLAEPFTQTIMQYTNNRILIPYCDDWHGGMNDQMCLGDPKWMHKMCNQILYIDEYFKDPHMTIHPERLLLHHVIAQKIPVRKFSYTYYMRTRMQCGYR